MRNRKKAGLTFVLLALMAVTLVGCGGLFNKEPVTFIQATPIDGEAPLTVNFTAKVTDDGTIISYEWSFGDGVNAVGSSQWDLTP